jgi:hypothetical protein
MLTQELLSPRYLQVRVSTRRHQTGPHSRSDQPALHPRPAVKTAGTGQQTCRCGNSPIYKLHVFLYLSLCCTPPVVTRTQYKRFTFGYSSPCTLHLLCKHPRPGLTIGDLAFFGTWNLNKVRSDESEFRSLQVLC